MMVQAVEGGTGTAARRSPASRSAARREPPRPASPGVYNTSWFIAFAAASGERPSLAIAVVVEDQASTGGATAAPIARAVMEAILPSDVESLNVPITRMSTTDQRQGALFAGRYRLERKLGSGGMADVWLAEDQELGRKVAVKILHERYANDDQFVERFRREATHAASLSHPNIVSIFDRGEAERLVLHRRWSTSRAAR